MQIIELYCIFVIIEPLLFVLVDAAGPTPAVPSGTASRIYRHSFLKQYFEK